ncbi:MAG TPA: hypothetical protein VNN20_16945 [Thermodesulfobacteriota bacterium]|jgi:Tfp pilus assembly protein FimT|nr:hypothetical protein [Thermodesulfobacteriota bacterium]
MGFMKREEGFNIVEILMVAGVMMAIIVIAGSMSGRFAARRSVDNMTRNLSSTLQLAKLNAVRQGVEYRAVLASCTQLDNADPDCPVCDAYDDYAPGDDTITITIERGDSNRGSTNWCVVSTQTRRVQQGMALDLTNIPETAPRRFNFNPNGTLVDQTGAILAQQIDIGVEPAAGAKVRRCGRVTVTPLGRIGIVEGNWDQGASECKPITK